MIDTMIYALKEIPILISEIYDSTVELGAKGCAIALVNKTYSVAKDIFTAGIYIALMHQHSYLLLVSFTIGIACPDFVMEKTSAIWAAIFQTKELPPLDHTAKKIARIWHGIKNVFNSIKPALIAGFIGLMALPVLTVHLIAIFAGLRLGAYYGKMADLSHCKEQPFYA